MGKEEIFNYLKNSKIQDKMLEQICYYFAKDFTASQTAVELKISRQTINNYYKIIRNLLLVKQEELILFMKDNNLCKNSFSIKYIKSGNNISYFIECNEKVFLFKNNNHFLPNIEHFIEESLDSKLLKNTKANSAKVIFNIKNKKYLITNLYKSHNLMQEFIDKRLKKFRGLTKETFSLHLKESQFRYNYSQEYLYQTIIQMLNLNTKRRAF
jgi:hypothetical protein